MVVTTLTKLEENVTTFTYFTQYFPYACAQVKICIAPLTTFAISIHFLIMCNHCLIPRHTEKCAFQENGPGGGGLV